MVGIDRNLSGHAVESLALVHNVILLILHTSIDEYSWDEDTLPTCDSMIDTTSKDFEINFLVERIVLVREY